MRNSAIETGNQTDKLNFKVKDIQNRYKEERTDKEFYHKAALESKKECKMLRIAVARL
jgi:hypothetical protein